MKKVFLTIATAALFSVNVFAADGGKKTDETTVKISYSVQHSFAADFAGAQNVVWSVTNNCQKAEFVMDGVKRTAFYNYSGEFLGTTQTVGYSAIPVKSQALITARYPEYKAVSVIVYQTNEDLNTTIEPVSYFVDLKSDLHEILVRVTNEGKPDLFKQVK